jgi:primosomal protein N' (replication factor Y)
MKVPVLIPKVFNFPMTYESGNQKSLKPGDLVIVPFGKKKEIGVIWDKIQISKKIFKIKTIEKKLDSFSIKKNLIEYINWFSSYNLVSKGMVLKMCLGNENNAIKAEKFKNQKLTINTSKFYLNNEQKKSLADLKKFGKSFNVSFLQ